MLRVCEESTGLTAAMGENDFQSGLHHKTGTNRVGSTPSYEANISQLVHWRETRQRERKKNYNNEGLTSHL